MIRRTAFDFPLAIFLASAVLGLWTAYDQDAAWAKFWPIVIGVAAFYAVAWMPERVGQVDPLQVIFAALPAIIGGYFLLTNDWREPGNATRWLYERVPQIAEAFPALSGYRLHANTLSGFMAVFIPLQIAAFFSSAAARLRPLRAALGLIAVGFSLVMLVLGRSQGAVWALALTSAGWLLHLVYARVNRRWAWPMALVTLAAPLVIGAALFGERLLEWRGDRTDVWQNSFALASDYPFTGLGLDNFVMPYSTYVLLVHVEHTYHAHNLYLDLWLNQGLPGLIAFVMMLLVAFTRRNTASQWRTAALAAVTVLALHGIVDDALYGYHGGKLAALMFMPFGLLARPEARFAEDSRAAQAGRLRLTILVFAGAAAVVASVVMAVLPATRAAFYRNLGALAQTKAELSAYRMHREGNLQDGMRLRPDVNLQPAMDDYLAALAENPWDAGANRRLAQIELTFRRYDQAHDRLLKAYASAPYHRATRQLLGESYAIRGEVAEAVRLWRTLDVSQGQLMIRMWWYALFTQQEERARWIERAMAALEQ
ncbi:MAG: O-antigen ligase family protein [Anaerolineae bacterium]|nr:O-antigen ligase family protein [Candidatus Roseilinea sp.]MDW8448870.1 O-antigen ligase family protein [Anaerolineae bacterium]